MALLIALATPAAALGEPSEAADHDIEAILDRMTLEEKIGQMMISSFRVWKELPDPNDANATVENADQEIPAVNVTELNDAIRACLRDCHFGGTLLFSENCRDAEQVLRLVADMQSENQAGGGLPMLVAVDQEGGIVVRLGFGTSGPGNMALAATGDPANAEAMAAIYGEELRLLGIHVDFAPVMDVNDNPNNPVIGVRAFSDSPETVSAFGASFLEGLHAAGTIASLKHFPGHGNTDTDSHTGLPCIDRSYEELKAVELVPFQAAIDAGADMVMTAHIQYPQIETQTYASTSTGEAICLPATMSRTILTDILREDMGFEGVVVSDALDMAAISDNFTTEDTLRLTINAGVNMLILPIITNTDLFRKTRDMVDMAVRMAEDGEIGMARVDDSVRRILTLKRKYGLLERTDFTVSAEQAEAAATGVGSAAHRQAAWDIARKALTLVKNENGAFPAELKKGGKAMILFADSCASRAGAGELVRGMLELPEGAELIVMANTADNGDECVAAALEADAAVLVSRVYNAACLDPNSDDGFSTAVFDRIIKARHEAGKTVIVVSCQLPYDAARFPEADAILLTYGSSAMRAVPPTEGQDSAWAPNLPAALCACFGPGEISGRLPVNLPALNEDYSISDTILYATEN